MSGLVVEIGADTTKLDRGVTSAIGTAQRGAIALGAQALRIDQIFAMVGKSVGASFGPISASLGDVTGEAGKLDGVLGGLAGPVRMVLDGLMAYQAATTVWKAFNAQLEDSEARLKRLTSIADSARQVGTGTTFYQSLIAQAKEAGIEAEKLTGMLERAREAATVRIGEGKDGVNESAFQTRLRQNVMAGNLTSDDIASYNAATSGEARIKAVLDLIEKLKAEQRNLAANDLGKTFFGPNFEQQLNAGTNIIGAFRRALDGLDVAGGVIIATPEEIARQEEMRQKLATINDTIANAIRPAVQDFNYLSDIGRQTWVDWQLKVAEWVEWLGKGYLVVRDLAKQVRDLAVSWGLIGDTSPTSGEGGDGPLAVRVKPRRGGADRSNPLPSLSSARGARDAPDPDSVRSVIQQLEKTRDIAEAELRTVGLTNLEKEKAVGLAKAEAAARADVEKGNRESAALTADETARVLAAASATATFKDRQKDLEQQLRSNAETARYFGSTLADALGDAVFEGKNLSDVLNNLIKLLGRAALQSLFTGQGPLASLMGLAPAASAGPNAVGGLAGIVGGFLGIGGSSGIGETAGPGIWLAGGGLVEGPGTGTSDSVRAMLDDGTDVRLSRGEFVTKAAATKRHLPLLEAINDGSLDRYLARPQARPLRFARGGLIPDGIPQRRQLAAEAAGALGKMEGGGGSMNVSIEPPAGHRAQVQERRSPTGMEARVVFEQMFAEDIANGGPMAQTLQGVYGVNRMTGRRS